MTSARVLLSCVLVLTLATAAGAASGDSTGPAAPPAIAACKPPAKCQVRLPQDFVPMTRTERVAQFERQLFGMRALAFTVVRSAINQGLDRPREWDQGGRGFGYRLASGYAQHAISAAFEDGIALGLDEDNRYFVSGKQGFGGRLKYAIASSFLARHDNGTRGLSLSALGGPAAGAFISRLWQPDSVNSAGDAAVSFGISEGIHVGMNVAREFAPRFVRRLLR